MRKFNYTEAVTHNGQFHADDVFATALIRILNPDIKIRRVRQVPEDFKGLVYDIGGGEFDHHDEKTKEVRKNNVPYASFGKLWREFGENLTTKEHVIDMDKKLVQHIDDMDNGGSYNPLTGMIHSFNPTWDDDKTITEEFERAVAIASLIIRQQLKQFKSIDRAKVIIDKGLEEMKDNILILERPVPWGRYVVPSDAVFVIEPTFGEATYMLKTVYKPKTKNSQIKCRIDNSDEAKAIIDVVSIGNKFAKTKTIDAAIELAKLSMTKNKEEV